MIRSSYPLVSLGLLLLLFFLVACDERRQQNLDAQGTDILKKHEVKTSNIPYQEMDTVYVPIYSDIYSLTKDNRFFLTATLSIRNTSLYDSLFLQRIDYYDTGGELVRSYINNTLGLQPMESIEYVIEEEDKAGGSGANFIIVWGARSEGVKPLFQGVMISTMGQQGISFITEGVSISRQ